MRALISILFGVRDNKIGWVSEEEILVLPAIGMPVSLNLGSEYDEPVEGQVYRAWKDEDGEPGGMLIYGGTRIPDTRFQELMEIAGWEQLTDEALQILGSAVDETPVLAATHEVVLVIGDPAEIDSLQTFQRTLNPYDPALPLFSQRLRLEIAQDLEEDEYNEVEEADDELTDAEWDMRRIQETAEINKELLNTALIDGITKGIPAVTIYSAIISNGVGRIAFWTPNLGRLAPENLVANGWEQLLVPQQFDPEDFRLRERVGLARQTAVTFEITDYGTARIKDWTMNDPLAVTEDQYPLLPEILVEHVKAAGEFTNIDTYLEEWSKYSSDEDTAS
jgi:hypothetical protein